MGEQSKISWTDATFNTHWGCEEVGPGCDNCYARDWAMRSGYPDAWNKAYRYFGDKHWNEPRKWNRKAQKEGRRLKVFCASMADWADLRAPGELRIRLFDLIRETPWLIWQLLTKRVGNVSRMLPSDWGDGYENVWMGATVVNQEEADRDIPKLLDIPARLRWLSIEPQLGPIDLTALFLLSDIEYQSIDWIIYGGESGSLERVRPFNVEWARDGIRQCRDAGVACFVKQMGAKTFMEPKDGAPLLRTFSHADAADPEKWTEDLRIQCFPKGME